jgi:hypothetical protein
LKTELLREVVLTDQMNMTLHLSTDGDSDYQYVYRAGKDVHWNANSCTFSSPIAQAKSCSAAFAHIIDAVEGELGVALRVSKMTKWQNISAQEQAQILSRYQA